MKSPFTTETDQYEFESPEWGNSLETLSAFEQEEDEFRPSAPPTSGSDRETAAVRSAIAQGTRDENVLANMIFNARHPERNRRNLNAAEPNFERLRQEWLGIRDRVVRPVLRSATGVVNVPSRPSVKCVEERKCAWTGCTETATPVAQRMKALVPFLKKYGSDLPIDFLLGWILVESGGCLSVVTGICERGYFQIHPGEACDIGADPRRLSADREYSVQKGIEMVRRKMIRAQSVGFVPGTDVFWHFTKLLHWLPAGVNAIVQSMKAKGGLPRTWQEFSKFVEDNRIDIIRRLAAGVKQPGLVDVILEKRPPEIHPWDPIKGVQNATKTLEAGRNWAKQLFKTDDTKTPAPARTAPIVPAPARTAPIAPAPARTSPTSSIIFGLDTYSGDRNANPNWAQAKALVPIHFAIIKSNEGLGEDGAFKREWPRLKDAGIVRGAYLFLQFPHPQNGMRAPDPAAQARAFIKTVGGLRDPDLPPSLDVEFPGDKRYPHVSGGSLTGMNERQLLAGVHEAWKVLKNEYGVAPIIYTSARVWLEDLKNIAAPQLVESPLWLAKPWPVDLHAPAIWNPAIFAGGRLNPKVPPPWGDSTNWWIHQYQGDADITRLPGFRQVDMNRFNPMLLGATGHRVRWVQRRLGIAQNGQFDSAMDGALRAFKAKRGLDSETGVGLRTFASLCWSNP